MVDKSEKMVDQVVNEPEDLSKDRCGTCRYFNQSKVDLRKGDCMRYPPTPFIITGPAGQPIGSYADFPKVQTRLWCGEFGPKTAQ